MFFVVVLFCFCVFLIAFQFSAIGYSYLPHACPLTTNSCQISFRDMYVPSAFKVILTTTRTSCSLGKPYLSIEASHSTLSLVSSFIHSLFPLFIYPHGNCVFLAFGGPLC